MDTTVQQRFKFFVEFDQEPMNDEDAMRHVMHMVRWAGSSVRVRPISEDHVLIDRVRFERLLDAASYAETVNWKLADLAPGDLDPIP